MKASFGSTMSKMRSGPSMTSVLLSAEAQTARIIGITSDRPAAGVSLAAESLAKAYASFGRRTLLVQVKDTGAATETASPASALKNHQPSGMSGLDRVTLNTLPMEKDTAVYRRIFESGLADYDIIIADLPPVAARANRTPAEILAPVSAADAVYLVCLTGEAQRASITRCIEMCTIGAVKLSGVILNDWKMPVSSMLILETRKPPSPETQPEYGA